MQRAMSMPTKRAVPCPVRNQYYGGSSARYDSDDDGRGEEREEEDDDEAEQEGGMFLCARSAPSAREHADDCADTAGFWGSGHDVTEMSAGYEKHSSGHSHAGSEPSSPLTSPMNDMGLQGAVVAEGARLRMAAHCNSPEEEEDEDEERGEEEEEEEEEEEGVGGIGDHVMGYDDSRWFRDEPREDEAAAAAHSDHMAAWDEPERGLGPPQHAVGGMGMMGADGMDSGMHMGHEAEAEDDPCSDLAAMPGLHAHAGYHDSGRAAAGRAFAYDDLGGFDPMQEPDDLAALAEHLGACLPNCEQLEMLAMDTAHGPSCRNPAIQFNWAYICACARVHA